MSLSHISTLAGMIGRGLAVNQYQDYCRLSIILRACLLIINSSAVLKASRPWVASDKVTQTSLKPFLSGSAARLPPV